jgi:hypothetical protein
MEGAAYAILVEHPFDGEDAELASIVCRLVARVSGPVVRAADVRALGLGAPPEEPPTTVESEPSSRKKTA